MSYHVVRIVEKALRFEGLDPTSSKIAVLGVAYKEGIDDTRESPAKIIVHELVKKAERCSP
ncbi:MAG: UDP binding domain-containing protein [Desulfurococcaceae archaeon]